MFRRHDLSAPIHHPTSESALKIQKAFLGFLVRKSFRKVIDLSRRVEEIQRRVCQAESFNLIMNSEMERIKVNEALMSLILQLDSLPVYSAVRICRKTVIKKAIALQEAIDAIGTIESNADDMQVCPTTVAVNNNQNCNADFVMVENEAEAPEEASVLSSQSRTASDSGGELERIVQVAVKSSMSNKELLEKMMDDNKKLMNMMQEAFEMNHLQGQSIGSLTLRVEQLERARINDNLRKIRKQRHEIEIVSSDR